MNQTNGQNEQNMDAFAMAAQLRAQAEALEAKERMRLRLKELIEISKDPYYDQYLEQMMKDLESGKATPAQVQKEADRTFRLYQQRMGQSIAEQPIQVQPIQIQPIQAQPMTMIQNQQPTKSKDTVEFKIGAGIFSTLGAVFVLVALVIFGFNFLDGIMQGMCIYIAAAAVILISELAVKRLSKNFSLVISAIGISSLFIATVINYLVLKNISGLVASLITIAIAVFAVLYSRKKEAASIRLIACLGCYVCFLPIKGFESELSFIITAGMIFAVNMVFIMLPNQKNRTLINCVHMIAHVIFTIIVTCVVISDNIGIMYVSLFVVLELVILNLIYLSCKNEVTLNISIIYGIVLGIFNVILICVACINHDFDSDEIVLFYKLLTEIMVIAVSIVFFIMWAQEKQRWMQYYFIAAIIITFNGFSEYALEAVISSILIWGVTRFLCKKEKELWVLDSILVIMTMMQGLYYLDEWYVIPIILAFLASIFTIKHWHIYHEIIVTVFFVMIILIDEWDFINLSVGDWCAPLAILTLVLLFLLFNHLPMLKGKNQFAYNVVNLVFGGVISLFAFEVDSYWVNSVTMLIGTILIIVAFNKKYGLAIPKKFLVLAGYLTYMIIAAGFETPVIVSVLLMIVAIICVAIGFACKDKVYRICGLVMAIIVCVKLIAYDFSELETMAKAILFLAVGVIALAISFLYIYLEKKEDEEMQSEKGGM